MKFIASCLVSVQYHVLSVFDTESETEGFFSFKGSHLCQGFAWMPGTVNFLVTDEDGELSEALVKVYLSDHIELCPDTFRAIQVPFKVQDAGISFFNDGKIVSGTATLSPTGQNVTVPVPPSQYALVCEIKFRDDEEYLNSDEYYARHEVGLRDLWCRLTFVPQENPEPAILREDSYLNFKRNNGIFCMEAEPA